METRQPEIYIIKKIICSIRKYLTELTKYQDLPFKNYCKPLIKIQSANQSASQSASKTRKTKGSYAKSRTTQSTRNKQND
uniref:Uncharacterized protein n=1 Tax=viral metagenome TaxID=1070528 RepID=A0A6C0HQY8_9ZZZZ